MTATPSLQGEGKGPTVPELESEQRDTARARREVPLISVVTVTLNDKAGLEKTIASVMGQADADRLDHIIVDGGSDYDVAGVVAALGSKARLRSEPDDGLFYAMNKGLRLATGTYIIFMNSGDCFAESDVVQHLGKATGNGMADVVYGDSRERLQSGDLVYKRSRDMRWIGIGMNTHHQSIFYGRQMLTRANIRYNTDYRLAADYEFTLRSYRAARNVARLNSPVAEFQSGGRSQEQYQEAHREQSRIREDIYGSKTFARLILTGHLLNGLLRRRLPQIYWWLKK
jgi:putative colanic acid biosynthesis glycosyltransferase WcaE